MSKNNGGPAFPALYQGDTRSDCPGLSMRDYFAAKAMQSMLRDPMAMGCLRKSLENTMQVISRDAYAAADAMLAERDREQ